MPTSRVAVGGRVAGRSPATPQRSSRACREGGIEGSGGIYQLTRKGDRLPTLLLEDNRTLDSNSWRPEKSPLIPRRGAYASAGSSVGEPRVDPSLNAKGPVLLGRAGGPVYRARDQAELCLWPNSDLIALSRVLGRTPRGQLSTWIADLCPTVSLVCEGPDLDMSGTRRADAD